MALDYTDVTELAGDEVSTEQIERICSRYSWAAQYCGGKDVVEAACGTGQGLGILQKRAASICAGDISQPMVDIARSHYRSRVKIRNFDACQMPFPDASKDVIILFEAIYYLPDAEAFVRECKRVLRSNGHVLIATANKDLFDFNPSPYAYEYFGAVELLELFHKHGFQAQCYGDYRLSDLSTWQNILRPIKKLAVALHLIPKSMNAKKFLKRIVFGKLTTMPAEIAEEMVKERQIEALPPNKPDRIHKVIYCAAVTR